MGILPDPFALLGGSAANDANAKQARKDREFQERMSSTAHRRQVKDLEAAGLNPILSATGGASTPSGAQATAENVGQAAISSAVEAKQLAVAIKKNEAEIGLINSQRNKTDVDATVASKGIPEADVKNKIYQGFKPLFGKIENSVRSSAKGAQELLTGDWGTRANIELKDVPKNKQKRVNRLENNPTKKGY